MSSQERHGHYCECMRYVDSGSRDPKDALGTWLGNELIGGVPIAALRVQSGFFGSDALGYFEDALSMLGRSNGDTRFLIGSNDGQTPRAAIADLLAVAGRPRSGLHIGVVSFQAGFFHPKVFHFQRADGSSTAYVGSANLTVSGTTSLHVEAGLVLDSKRGDSSDVLDSIADSIDAWFCNARAGLYQVVTDADLDPLVQANVLGVVQPPRRTPAVRPVKSKAAGVTPGHSLKPLVAAPPVRRPLSSRPQAAAGASAGGNQQSTGGAQTMPTPQSPPPKHAAVKHWAKKLSDSDAQRKKTGNQRGAITLVKGDYRGKIDQTTYFRTDLFGQQKWVKGTTRTGKPIETATIPMKVIIDGVYHGTLDFKVTNGSSRESGQDNYTAELHIEPIGAIVRQTNIAGKRLDVTLDAHGDYWLEIG